MELEAFREIVKECYEQIIEVPKVLRFRDLLKKFYCSFHTSDTDKFMIALPKIMEFD